MTDFKYNFLKIRFYFANCAKLHILAIFVATFS